MRRSIWLRHDAVLLHDVPGHPERPARIRALEGEMSAHEWFGCTRVEAPRVARESLLAVHPESHVAAIEELCAAGGGAIDADTFAVEATWEASLRAAGGAVALVDALVGGEAQFGVSALRPPGHHAERDRAMGFCFFNNVAAAARRACAVHGLERVLIVETEAYLGPDDLASHARFGPTARTSVMFGPGGVSYVYLCYGIHEMFNIVTGTVGDGQAVLIRAVAPLVGVPVDPSVGRGPGKVTKALLLDRRHDRKDLARGQLFVAGHAEPPALGIGPRIGVDYAGAWAAKPLRFWWRDHPSVSRAKKS